MLKPLERARMVCAETLSLEVNSRITMDTRNFIFMIYRDKEELPLSNHPSDGFVDLVDIKLLLPNTLKLFC